MARRQQAVQHLEGGCDVAAVDGIVELPRHDRPGVPSVDGHILGGDGAPGAQRALQGPHQPHDVAAVGAHQVLHRRGRGRPEAEAGPVQLIAQPLAGLGLAGRRGRVQSGAPGGLHCGREGLGDRGQAAAHGGVRSPLPHQDQVGGGRQALQQAHQLVALAGPGEPRQVAAHHHPARSQEGLGLGCVHEPSEAPSSVGIPEAGLVELLQRQAAVLVAQRLLDDPGHRLGDQHRVVAGDELDAHRRDRAFERSARQYSDNPIAGRMIGLPERGRG